MNFAAMVASWLAMLVPGVATTPSAEPWNPIYPGCAQLWFEDPGYVLANGASTTKAQWVLETGYCE